jgi:hypothetical protein
MKFEIIWPDRRWVSEDQIKMWYLDAMDNGDIDDEGIFDDAEEMAKELHNIGTITLGRGRQ